MRIATRWWPLLGLLAIAAGFLLAPAAPSAPVANTPPKLTPIKAIFIPRFFETSYTASATDTDGDKLKLSWQLSPPVVDPNCKKFATVSPKQAIWHHGDQDGCNHAVQGPRGHRGVVRFLVYDGFWTCTEIYSGTLTGTGTGGAVCLKTLPPPPPARYSCTGSQIKLFDNSNGGGVQNGGKPPSFSTNGKAYCLASITTYHWNNGQGKTPGTIGLTGSSTAGPFAAKGSSGQGGAPNVNWTVNLPTTKPVVINGTYTCQDSDPASWSQDQQSGGNGFCIVYVVNAVKKAGSGTTTTTKTTTTKKPTTPAKRSNKLAIKATPDSGNPPLTVTLTLSSPAVVQWRVDFGDGQSKVGIGRPPATLTHKYAAKGDYKPRLSVITSPTAATASSVTTNVQVGTALMAFTATPATGNPPLKVTFALGTIVQSITTWSLDFGDGQHTGGGGKPPASVSHTYTTAGSFRATFVVKPGHYALVAAFAQVTVGGGTPPTLSLTAAPTSGRHPLAVTFRLGSNIPGQIVSWQLQFGDGFRSGGSGRPPASVAHTYTRAGTYAAFLIVAQQQHYGGVQYIVPRGGLIVSVK